MRKKLVIIGLITLVICVSLSGCNEDNNTLNPEENRFVGTWQNTTMWQNKPTGVNLTISFNPNGTYTGRSTAGGSVNGTWDVKDNKLVTNTPRKNNSEIITKFTYAFSNSDRTLTLTNANTGGLQVWTKQ